MRPFNAGVDTLVIGYSMAGPISRAVYRRLYYAKFLAGSDKYRRASAVVKLGGLTFTVSASGAERYEFLVTNGDFTARIARKWNAGMYYPEIVVEYRSVFLWREGYESAMAVVREWLKLLGRITNETVSRIDGAVDCEGALPVFDPWGKGVRGYARTRTEFAGRAVGSGLGIQTYQFGAGDIVFRAYGKSDEIRKRNKQWFESIWRKAGWDGVQPVTRFEFQLRRDAIRSWEKSLEKQGKAVTIEALLSNAWWYITNKWLTIREPQGANSGRWPVVAWWATLQVAWSMFGHTYGFLRCQSSRGAVNGLLAQAFGCFHKAAALAAGEATVIELARSWLISMAIDRLSDPETLTAIAVKLNSVQGVPDKLPVRRFALRVMPGELELMQREGEPA